MAKTKITNEEIVALKSGETLKVDESTEIKKLGIHYIVNVKGLKRRFDKAPAILEFLARDSKQISKDEKIIVKEIVSRKKQERKEIAKVEKKAHREEIKARRRASKFRKFIADISYIGFSLAFAVVGVLLVGLPQLITILTNNLGVDQAVIVSIKDAISGVVGGNIKYYVAIGVAVVLLLISISVQLQRTTTSKVLGLFVGVIVFGGVTFGLSYLNAGGVLVFDDLFIGFKGIFGGIGGTEIKDYVQVGLFGVSALQLIIPLTIGWKKKA